MPKDTKGSELLKLFDEAVSLHNAGELEQAQKCYQHLLALDPKHAESHYNLATVFAQLGQWQQAIIHYKHALLTTQKAAQVHYNLSIAYLQTKHIAAAIEHLELSLRDNPDHFEAQHLLACLLLHSSQLKKAELHFLAALELQPNDEQTHFNLAVLLLKQQQYDAALAHFQQAVLLQPGYIEAQYNVGIVYQKKNDIDEAITAFEDTLVIDEQYFEAHYNLVLLHIERGNQEQALIHCNAGLALKHDSPGLRFLRHALTQDDIPTKAPQDYLQSLFDNYAEHYDQHLQTSLNYKVPAIIYQVIIELKLLADRQTRVLLDLGCGTGLVGEQFKDFASKMIGVDISGKMLAKARAKGLYQQLVEQDIEDFLTKQQTPVDLIIAAEVFNYIGELQAIFSQCARTLTSGGILVFTTEVAADSYQLQLLGRYAHANSYLQQLAAALQLDCLLSKEIVLRKHDGKDLPGTLTILQKL